MKIFERSQQMRRVHSCSETRAASGRSNATQGTPSRESHAIFRSVQPHHRSTSRRTTHPIRPIVRAAFPHAPHHRRQATSHIAARVAGRYSFVQPPPVLFSKRVVFRYCHRHRRADDHVLEDAIRTSSDVHPFRSLAADTTFQADSDIPP